jgi:hypothetical protein
MRKVKFTQDTFDEKLGRIISEFPVLDVSKAKPCRGSSLALASVSNTFCRTSTHSSPPC